MRNTNFGRNILLTPKTCYTPRNEQDVLDILDQHRGQQIRCVGRLHSWSKVIESNDVLLDLRYLEEIEPASDAESPAVSVGAGCQIKRLLAELYRLKGWTLPSVGFITEQTVAGAISTGTHGSGKNSLSHYVTSVRIARYDANSGTAMIVEINGGDELLAARCSLGCMGIILSVTMRCRPVYFVEEHFREYNLLQSVIGAETESSLQQFYLVPWRWTYFAQHRCESNRPISRTVAFYHWYRFLVFDILMHLTILLAVRLFRWRTVVRFLFRWIIPAFVVRDWRVTGLANSQLVMEHELFRHVELELFVPSDRLASAMSFVRQILSIADGSSATIDAPYSRAIAAAGLEDDLTALRSSYTHHYPICVRKILSDSTLVSMASPHTKLTTSDTRPIWYSVTFTCYHRADHRVAFEGLATFLTRSMAGMFDARPHWGKLCLLSMEELRALYPRFDLFRRICHEADPSGSFQNDWTRSLLATSSDIELNRIPSRSQPEPWC